MNETMTLEEANDAFHSRIGQMFTCNEHLSVVGKTPTGLWVVHHSSHAEYLNRFEGSTTCASWWGLWDGSSFDHRKGLIKGQMTQFYAGPNGKRHMKQYAGGWE